MKAAERVALYFSRTDTAGDYFAIGEVAPGKYAAQIISSDGSSMLTVALSNDDLNVLGRILHS